MSKSELWKQYKRMNPNTRASWRGLTINRLKSMIRRYRIGRSIRRRGAGILEDLDLYTVSEGSIFGRAVRNKQLDFEPELFFNQENQERLDRIIRTEGDFNTSQNQVVYINVGYYFSMPEGTSQRFGKTFRNGVDWNMIENLKNGNENYLDAYITHIKFLIIDLGGNGGCDDRKHLLKLPVDKYTDIHLYSVKSKNNNCFINGLFNELGIKKRADNVRNELGIEIGTKLGFTEITKVCEYAYVLKEFQLEIYNHNSKVIYNFHKGEGDGVTSVKLIKLYLVVEHYYQFKNSYTKQKCQQCGTDYLYKHKCNKKKLCYYQAQIYKKRVINNQSIKHESIGKEKILTFDFETFEVETLATPYAVGFKDGTKEYMMYEGKDCLKQFVDYLMKVKNKTIVAYNGSGFDFYFIIQELNSRGVELKNLLLNAGKVLKADFNGNSMFDLYRFTNCSLKKACKSFNIKNAKSDFDHNLIKCWEDVDIHRNGDKGWKPYLKLDVLGLDELFWKFYDIVYDEFGASITKYCTLSSMAFSIWKSTLKTDIHLPNEEQYEYIRKGIYGGRTYPMKKIFKTESNLDYKSVVKSKDFIFNADVNSLYPAAMVGIDFAGDLSFPAGEGKFVDNGKKYFDNGYMGYYTIEYEPNKDITVPILPKHDNGLKWDLKGGSTANGVYTNIDIKNAIKYGYKIKFSKALVWEKTCNNVFTEYISKCYKGKNKAKINDNKVKYQIYKLLMNGLYGKMLQRKTIDSHAVIHNIKHLREFLKDNILVDYVIMDKGKESILVVGRKKDEEKCITKPSQLGGFILSYSRQIMLKYFDMVSNGLKEIPFTYSDTDSLHIYGKKYDIIKKWIHPTKLGYLDNDCDGLIIEEVNLGPKKYMYKYITEDNKVEVVMKCKGLMRDKLELQWYAGNNGVVKWNSLAKIHQRISKKDKGKIMPFSIRHIERTRKFEYKLWEGMEFKDNTWKPYS